MTGAPTTETGVCELEAQAPRPAPDRRVITSGLAKAALDWTGDDEKWVAFREAVLLAAARVAS